MSFIAVQLKYMEDQPVCACDLMPSDPVTLRPWDLPCHQTTRNTARGTVDLIGPDWTFDQSKQCSSKTEPNSETDEGNLGKGILALCPGYSRTA